MDLQVNHSLTLPSNEFFLTEGPKTGVCLHHTVGGTAASTLDWWKRDGHIVGTAYLIGRDGTIYEIFDPHAWAWQFGLKRTEWSNTNGAPSKDGSSASRLPARAG